MFAIITLNYTSVPEGTEAATRGVLYKKMFLTISQKSQENTWQPQACNFMKKDTLVQVFSCKFFEIFKNTFLIKHLRKNASKGTFEFSKLSVKLKV